MLPAAETCSPGLLTSQQPALLLLKGLHSSWYGSPCLLTHLFQPRPEPLLCAKLRAGHAPAPWLPPNPAL